MVLPEMWSKRLAGVLPQGASLVEIWSKIMKDRDWIKLNQAQWLWCFWLRDGGLQRKCVNEFDELSVWDWCLEHSFDALNTNNYSKHWTSCHGICDCQVAPIVCGIPSWSLNDCSPSLEWRHKWYTPRCCGFPTAQPWACSWHHGTSDDLWEAERRLEHHQLGQKRQESEVKASGYRMVTGTSVVAPFLEDDSHSHGYGPLPKRECPPVIEELVCEAWAKPPVLGIAFTEMNEPLFLESKMEGQGRSVAFQQSCWIEATFFWSF